LAKIKVTSKCELYDGMSITFNAPCDCTAVDGLNVYYENTSQAFTFRDAHGNDLAGVRDLFSEGSYVKVVLNTSLGYAYVQSGDTNSYIQAVFGDMEAKAEEATGTSTEIIVVDDRFQLVDGAKLRFKLPADTEDGITLNVNDTGPFPILHQDGTNLTEGQKAGTWLSVTYSSALASFTTASKGGDDGSLQHSQIATILLGQHLYFDDERRPLIWE
jgi:hypothetical protein